jgi:hypothetical protein
MIFIRVASVLALCISSIAACNGTSASEQEDLALAKGGPLQSSTVSMGVGVAVEVPVARLKVRLDSVTADSRCPTDVQCVHAGSATAHLWVELHEPHPAVIGPERVVLTSVAPKDTVRVFGRHLQLVSVQPVPLSSRRIEPSEYRIELRVSGER